MTEPGTTITDEDDFEEALATLLRIAHENDIPLEGGWTCRYRSDAPDWDVHVTELAKRAASPE